MNQATLPSRTSPRGIWFRAGAVFVLGVVAATIIYLSLRDNGGSSTSTSSSSAAAVSITQMQTLAQQLGHPIFWVGPKAGSTYELTRLSNGNVIVRYLPSASDVGSKSAYLSVATYPFTDAYTALQAVGKKSGTTTVDLPNGGIAVLSTKQPYNIHAAFPGVDYQAEIFDPTQGEAQSLVASGKLTAFGSLTPSTARPTAMNVNALTSLQSAVKHPIYWTGPEAGKTYEVTQSAGGQIYVRYLPKGVAVGSSKGFPTVATYPFRGAYKAILALTKQPGADKIALPNGGIALVDAKDPNSIHLAFRGVNYQIEVYNPSAAAARKAVTSGQIVAVG